MQAHRDALRGGPVARAHVGEEVLRLELIVRGLLLVRREVRICLVQSVKFSQAQKLEKEWTYSAQVHGGRASLPSVSPGPTVSTPGSHRTAAQSP